MKKTVKLLLPAFLAICLCVSLISGATFALFTSQSQINIAVTSGKVNVEASAALIKGYSALPEGGEVEIDPAADGTVTFSNGGVVSIDGNKLTVDRITPGDRIEFSISVANHSTVAIKYQTVVTFNTGDEALYRALNISVIDDDKLTNISSDRSTAVSDWTTVPEAEGTIDPIQVSIALPLTASNDIQEKEIDLLVGIYAVQANGNDTTNGDAYLVNKDSNLNELVDSIDDGTLALVDDVDVSDNNTFSIPEGKRITVDINGKQMSVTKENGEADPSQGLVINSGSEVTITNSRNDGALNITANADAGNWSSGPNGNYTLRVEAGGTLNLDDVDCTLQTGEGVGATHLVYVGGGTLNCSDSEIEFTGSGFASGFNVREGGTMNVENTTYHSTGAVGQFSVGYVNGREEPSTLNINKGTQLVYEDANSFAGAIVVNGTGNVNIDKDASITVCGEIPKEINDGEETNSAASAIRVVGGGNVVVNGTINLETTTQNGWAYAVMVFNNVYVDPTVAEGKVAAGLIVDVHIDITESARIIVNEHAIIFAAQENAKLKYGIGADGLPDPESAEYTITFAEQDGEPIPTITIHNGATITCNGKVVKSSDSVFSQGSSSTQRKFGEYTPNAIKDNRVID